MTKFTKDQKVLWHGAGPYEHRFELGGRSYVIAPDGWTLIAESIDLTPAPPEPEFVDTGLVTCEHPRGHHDAGHYQLPTCSNPTPLYRKTHVCESFEERFVESVLQRCDAHNNETPSYHVSFTSECVNLRPLGTMESVCTVCGVAR